MLKTGLLVYDEKNKYFNIGDYIQSLAAKQFFEKIDYFVPRQSLDKFKEDKISMIINGWLIPNGVWPPSKCIDALIISIHINPTEEKKILSDNGIEYFKLHEPIGCRDLHTMNVLKKNGVESFLSSCLTLTFPISLNNKKKVRLPLFVDCVYNIPETRDIVRNPKFYIKNLIFRKSFRSRDFYLKMIFTTDFLKKVEHETCMKSSNYSHLERFELAENMLTKLGSASIVYTSRIHIALPCLALGTPVVFINVGFDRIWENSRFEGLVDLFSIISLKKGKLEHNFNLSHKIDENFSILNKKEHLKYVEVLKENVKIYINKLYER